MTRTVVLVDGEHHAPAVRDVISELRSEGRDIVCAVYCGGAEKVDPDRAHEVYGLPVVRDSDVAGALRTALERFRPEVVLDLADEPVLMPADRFRLASIVLGAGAVYEGADFELRPPSFARRLHKPSIRVFATGKRTGKTTVSSALARRAAAAGHRPVIVAVGRGGPEPPQVIEPGTALDAAALVAMADRGLHAASDYVEDAVTSGVATIGCRRVGGGLAGGTVRSNARAAADIVDARDEDLAVLEGSGASFPDVDADAGIICVPAHATPDVVSGYLNPYRLLLADLAVVTMAEEGQAAAQIDELEAAIQDLAPGLDVVSVTSRPEPLSPIRGRRVFFCCTAPRRIGEVLREHLERVHDCTVVGMSHELADRKALEVTLRDVPDYDVMLTEIKGAGIDVAARGALETGHDVVFADNALSGEGIDDAFDRVIGLAIERRAMGANRGLGS